MARIGLPMITLNCRAKRLLLSRLESRQDSPAAAAACRPGTFFLSLSRHGVSDASGHRQRHAAIKLIGRLLSRAWVACDSIRPTAKPTSDSSSNNGVAYRHDGPTLHCVGPLPDAQTRISSLRRGQRSSAMRGALISAAGSRGPAGRRHDAL